MHSKAIRHNIFKKELKDTMLLVILEEYDDNGLE
jgi:hypothetical protein